MGCHGRQLLNSTVRSYRALNLYNQQCLLHSHFTDQETEAQRDRMTCPTTSRLHKAELRLKPSSVCRLSHTSVCYGRPHVPKTAPSSRAPTWPVSASMAPMAPPQHLTSRAHLEGWHLSVSRGHGLPGRREAGIEGKPVDSGVAVALYFGDVHGARGLCGYARDTEERAVTAAASGWDRSPPQLSAKELSPGLRLILGCGCCPSVLERVHREDGGR